MARRPSRIPRPADRRRCRQAQPAPGAPWPPRRGVRERRRRAPGRRRAARYRNSAAADGLDAPGRPEALEQLGTIASLLGAAANGLMRRFDAVGDDPAGRGFGGRSLLLDTTLDDAGRLRGDLTPEWPPPSPPSSPPSARTAAPKTCGLPSSAATTPSRKPG